MKNDSIIVVASEKNDNLLGVFSITSKCTVNDGKLSFCSEPPTTNTVQPSTYNERVPFFFW